MNKTLSLKMYENRIMLAKALLVAILILGVVPFLNIGVSNAKDTEDSTTEIQNIDDIDVSLSVDEDGKTKVNITGMDGTAEDTWNKVFVKYKGLVAAFLGIAAITLLVFMIKNCIGLAASSTNPTERNRHITGIAVTFIAAAICGSAATWIALSWTALK